MTSRFCVAYPASEQLAITRWRRMAGTATSPWMFICASSSETVPLSCRLYSMWSRSLVTTAGMEFPVERRFSSTDTMGSPSTTMTRFVTCISSRRLTGVWMVDFGRVRASLRVTIWPSELYDSSRKTTRIVNMSIIEVSCTSTFFLPLTLAFVLL